MTTHSIFNFSIKTMPQLRYWLFWGLLLAMLAFGFHTYFEYRNHELDKRLEQLQQSK